MDILKKINASGKTVILVTHNPELAAMTDRQVVLSDGKIIKDESLAVQI
jgi:putative ABC transport system ATP-binding protein